MMTSKNTSQWLGAPLSDSDGDAGYDSEIAEQKRPAKRRRILEDKNFLSTTAGGVDIIAEEQDNEDDFETKNEILEAFATVPTSSLIEAHEVQTNNESLQKRHSQPGGGNTSTPTRRVSEALGKGSTASRKTGVVYISRIPPFLKPSALRTLLSPYGSILRIFLTPEDPSRHTARVRSGGNKKRSFTDGWVEFASKKNAKIVAESLNTQIIGGKKGGWYHDDVWNIKYLKGFKWNHLTEQIANENAERAARLRLEISQTTRENKRFIQNVERAKMLEGMEAKRKKKGDISRDAAAEGPGSPSPAIPRVGVEKIDEQDSEPGEARQKKFAQGVDRTRHYRQNVVIHQSVDTSTLFGPPDEVKRVLSKIF